jgi:tRNA nucleotidyltransferase (CCA-adding enzyme)
MPACEDNYAVWEFAWLLDTKKKEEGRRKKEEGRRKKEEGRRKKEVGNYKTGTRNK